MGIEASLVIVFAQIKMFPIESNNFRSLTNKPRKLNACAIENLLTVGCSLCTVE